MYEIFEELLKTNNVSAYRVAQETGVTTATLTSWKQGKYAPKRDKLKKIADYFGVSLEYLQTGKDSEKESEEGKKYYFSDATAELAQELFENSDMRLLFDAAKDVKPEVLRNVTQLLEQMKGTNPDG